MVLIALNSNLARRAMQKQTLKDNFCIQEPVSSDKRFRIKGLVETTWTCVLKQAYQQRIAVLELQNATLGTKKGSGAFLRALRGQPDRYRPRRLDIGAARDDESPVKPSDSPSKTQVWPADLAA